jgi:hypothetical protein
MHTGLGKKQITQLFDALNIELQKDDTDGEIYLVGGAVMCLVYDARASTQDIDAFFKPSKKIREAAARVALNLGIDEHWLNDGVKGYLSTKEAFTSFLVLSHLKIMVAQPEYLLAMKCLSMRIGAEFQDIDDIRYLLRYLNISDYKKASIVISEYYPLDRFPQKTLYALEEICQPG